MNIKKRPLIIELPTASHSAIKALAARRGITIRDLVTPVLEQMILSAGDSAQSPRQIQNQDASLDQK